MHASHTIPLPGNVALQLGHDPVVMGILNVTPDSFSDGGAFNRVETAHAHARLMLAEGADIIDIGGESTRPGSEEIGTQEELDRVIPVFEALAAESAAKPLSIDTYKALVADQAIQSGARIINDVHGLQREPEMADVAALHGVPVVAMHWDKARDRDKPLLDEMRRWFDRTVEIAEGAGLPRERLIIDPGFGFAKTVAENYAMLRDLAKIYPGYPILAGTSRKSMIGKLLGNEPKDRLPGTIATNVLAYNQGAHIFRVHDVRANRDALRVAAATLYGPPAEIVEGSRAIHG
jgi:dihydropteroate synthase